jgi:hypothetical protein
VSEKKKKREDHDEEDELGVMLVARPAHAPSANHQLALAERSTPECSNEMLNSVHSFVFHIVSFRFFFLLGSTRRSRRTPQREEAGMGRRSGVRKPVTLGAPVQAAATTATAETKKKSRRGTKKSSSSGAEGGGGGEEVTGGEHAQLIAQYHALNKYRESLEHDPTLTPANRAAKRRKLDAQLAAVCTPPPAMLWVIHAVAITRLKHHPNHRRVCVCVCAVVLCVVPPQLGGLEAYQRARYLACTFPHQLTAAAAAGWWSR